MVNSPGNTETSGHEVLHALERESKKYRDRRKWRLWWFLAVFVIWAAKQLVNFQVPDVLMYAVIVAWSCIEFTSVSHLWAVRKAARSCDKQSAPYLLEALVMPQREIRNAARTALTESLSKLTEEDHSIFDPYQRGILYGQLGAIVTSPFGPNGPLFIGAVLNAIHRTGGAEAIPYVEDFEQRARKRGGAWRRLADQALLALPDLRMRAAKQIIDKKVVEVTESSEFDRERLEKLRDSGDILGKEGHERSRLGADSTGAG